MGQSQLPISDSIFSSKLNVALWQLQAKSEFDRQLIDNLLLILKMDLREIDEKMLTDNYSPDALKRFAQIDIVALTANKELQARVLDIQVVLNRSLIAKHIKKVAHDYFDVYSATENDLYLVRYLASIKRAKALFGKELSEIFDRLKPVIINKLSPYWLSRICVELTAIFGQDKCQDLLKNELEKRKAAYLAKGEYHFAADSINSMKAIGMFSEQRRNLELALILEQEADQIVAERKPNTFYPKISKILSAALNLVFDFEEGQEVKKRLILKLEAARLDDMKMTASVGTSMSPEIDFKKLLETVNKMNIQSFEDGWSTLMSVPILTNEMLNPTGEKPASSFLDQFFDTHERLSSKGKPIGTTKGDAAKENEARLHGREIMIILLKMIKDVTDVFGNPPEEFLLHSLVKIKSSFIPSDRVRIYALGLALGFQDDFLQAAHLLVPQIENSFRHIAELNGISVTNYNKHEEFENTFGGVLQKLTGVLGEEVIEELQSFFLDSSNVNFRNELMHGLMDQRRIEHYGIYVWWLALKLIYQTKI